MLKQNTSRHKKSNLLKTWILTLQAPEMKE